MAHTVDNAPPDGAPIFDLYPASPRRREIIDGAVDALLAFPENDTKVFFVPRAGMDAAPWTPLDDGCAMADDDRVTVTRTPNRFTDGETIIRAIHIATQDDAFWADPVTNRVLVPRAAAAA